MQACRLLLALALCWLVVIGSSASAQGANEYAQAVQLGVDEFEARNFLEARSHFMRAHELAPNARTFRALGMVEFELKNYVDAARYLQAALEDLDKPLDAQKRAETEQLYKRVSGYLARITLDIAPDTRVAVDGASEDVQGAQEMVLALGDHTLEFRAPNHISERRTVRIKGGEHQRLTVKLVPISDRAAGGGSSPSKDDVEPKRPLYKNPWLWTAVGLVVAGAAAGAAVAITRDPGTSTGSVDNGNGSRALVAGR